MTLTVAVLVFEDAAEMDIVGPIQVLAAARPGEGEALRILTVSLDGGEVSCESGLRILSDRTLDELAQPDILLIPGGSGALRAAEDPRILAWLAACGPGCRTLATVGCGAFPLVAAGLAAGHCITTHPAQVASLRVLGGAEVVEGVRFLCDDRLLSCTGAAAAVDMGLWLVEQLHGEVAVERVRHTIAPVSEALH